MAVLELARKARDHDLNFTVDAEEADRLELTLDVIAATLADPSLRGWEGFGLAVLESLRHHNSDAKVVFVGSRLEYGSWKMICIRLR